ncbi:MAG TPA: Ig-like domain-containing protein [Vicinamibacteria bacterium]|nr:Ig-like domain-containing protein [Vicinamibacteria bacterium]
MRRLAPALVLALGLAATADAQMNEYEGRYGPTIEVSVDSLLDMPEQYAGRAVRTRGQFEMIPSGSGQQYGLRGTFGGYLYIYPRQEVVASFEQEARRWAGREVEVQGSVERGQDPGTRQPIVYIAIWAYLAPPDDKPMKRPDSPDATLEDLVTKAERYDGKTVNVRGQFRGENLFGDLPSSSRDRSSDWVIKDDVFAVWVTGKKPKGSGWSLDASLKRDTGKWLQIMGRVRVRNRVVTLEAIDVVLSKPPAVSVAAAKAEPTPPPPPRPRRPPVVAFSLPIDGERELAPDTVFQIQFTRDMDEASLKDRVLLRYAGRPQPGDNSLDAVRMTYDGGLRTLRVDPGDLLRPGRIVELVLLPGIVDIDGVPLETRPGIRAGSSTDVLRFQVVAGGLAGGPNP